VCKVWFNFVGADDLVVILVFLLVKNLICIFFFWVCSILERR
jgi:hypothetical protein